MVKLKVKPIPESAPNCTYMVGFYFMQKQVPHEPNLSMCSWLFSHFQNSNLYTLDILVVILAIFIFEKERKQTPCQEYSGGRRESLIRISGDTCDCHNWESATGV